MNQDFDILYEDGPCLVVCKHAGVLTQAPPGIDSLEVQIKEFLKRREGAAEDVYLGLPHRLDRPATGVMIFAKDYRTTRRLGEQFEKRKVHKVYWACAEGQIRRTLARGRTLCIKYRACRARRLSPRAIPRGGRRCSTIAC